MRTFPWGSGRNPIKLIGINAPSQPRLQFGHEFRSDPDVRQDALQQSPFVQPNMQGRSSQQAAIKQPLPQREQTILSHRLSPELQRELAIGFSTPGNQGRKEQANPRHFAQLDRIEAGTIHSPPPSSEFRRQANCAVRAVPTISGQMALRTVYF